MVSAHGGNVARPPSFVERFGDRGGFLGDPSLRAESAWIADAGVSVAIAGRAARPENGEHTRNRAPRVRAEIVAFGTWASDLIAFVAEGAYGRARATNIGRARLLGAEAEIDASASVFDLRIAYTGLTTANEAECAAITGVVVASAPCVRPALPGRPSHDLVSDLTLSLGPLRLRYGVDAVSGIVADRAGNVVVPARVLQSAGARFDVRGLPDHVGTVRLALDLRNLFDVRTASYDGILGPVREPIGDAYQYPLPGRSFLLSATWSLRGP